MPALNFTESFNIVIDDNIEVDEYGDASCRRVYTFHNNTNESLRVEEEISWTDYFPDKTSEFFLIKNDGSKQRLVIGKKDSIQVVKVPIAKRQDIAPNNCITVSIEYKWKNFAVKLHENWIFKYVFNTKLTKVTVNVKVIVSGIKTFNVSNILKGLKIYCDKQELKQKGDALEGQFKDIDLLNVLGLYHHGFKRWVELVITILIGIIPILIWELLLRKMLL